MGNPKASISISIKALDKSIDIRRDETILEACLRHKIPMSHSCGGNATCGTCQVKVILGLENCGERNEYEQEMFNDRNFDNSTRLACQTMCLDSISIEVDSFEN